MLHKKSILIVVSSAIFLGRVVILTVAISLLLLGVIMIYFLLSYSALSYTEGEVLILWRKTFTLSAAGVILSVLCTTLKHHCTNRK